MTAILDFTIKSRSGKDKYTSDMCASVPKSLKNYILSISVRKTEKIGVIYILIAILFYVHLRVNVAAILDFFFKIHSTVMFILGSLSYYK